MNRNEVVILLNEMLKIDQLSTSDFFLNKRTPVRSDFDSDLLNNLVLKQVGDMTFISPLGMINTILQDVPITMMVAGEAPNEYITQFI